MPNAPFIGANRRDDSYSYGRPFITGGTNYYFWPGTLFSTSTNASYTANTDWYAPLRIRTPFVFDRVAGEVTVTGANLRWGMYRADLNFQPVGPPLFDSGSIATGTTGVKTYTPGTPVFVEAGRYLTVVNTDTACNLREFRDATDAIMDPSLGSGAYPGRFSVSRTYAAFPTPGTAWTTVDTNPASPGGYSTFVFRALSL